jgi:hypothetical protein
MAGFRDGVGAGATAIGKPALFGDHTIAKRIVPTRFVVGLNQTMREFAVITRVVNGWDRCAAPGPARRAVHVTVALMAALAVLGAAGCGGSSSKPAYCGDKTTLQNDVDALKSSLSSGDVSSLSSQVSTIKTDATTLVSSAKSDFPSQTSAITTSVDSLTTAANALPSNPSTSQIAALAVDAASVLSSINSFSDATSSTCS